MIRPLSVDRKLIRVDVLVMIAVALAAWLLAWDGRLGRIDGVSLLLGLALYTTLVLRAARREVRDAGERGEQRPPAGPAWRAGVISLTGLLLCVAGAHGLVRGAVSIASGFGVSPLVIGLTVVAAGTSLPELATSAVAAVRGQRDIAVRNVVGSNIFNMLGILGAAGAAAPGGRRWRRRRFGLICR